MAKRARLQQDEWCEDRISELVEDVVAHILSRLTLEEAVRTSVLSKAWKHKWKQITCLNFDASYALKSMKQTSAKKEITSANIMDTVELERTCYKKERPRYVKWVNHILDSYKDAAPAALDGFKIEFSLGNRHSSVISHWIDFAFRRNVRKLDLDFHPSCAYDDGDLVEGSLPPGGGTHNYVLPNDLGFSVCHSLTILRLKHVDVTAHILDYLLSNCLFLEHLCLWYSHSFSNLKLSRPSLRLKYLEIRNCASLENLEISVASLVSFKCVGPCVNLSLKNAPKLSEIEIGGPYCDFIICHDSRHLSSYITQIQKLVLRSFRVFEKYVDVDLVQFPVLSNLKHLELIVTAFGDDSFLCFRSLIEASPSLNKFVLKLVTNVNSRWPRRVGEKFSKTFSHPSLKTVELRGFVGRTVDVEFASYFVWIAADTLERVVFDTRHPRTCHPPQWPWQLLVQGTKARRKARELARYLKKQLPPTVTVIII